MVLNWFSGRQNKERTNINIKNALSTNIKLTVENVNETLNKSLTEITTNVINKATTTSESKTTTTAVGENIARGLNLSASAGGVTRITQEADARVKLEAIINIIANNESKNTTANEIASELTKKVSQDGEAKAKVMQAAKLDQISKQQQGIENMMNNITNTIGDTIQGLVDGLTGGSSDTEINQTIEQTINTSFENAIKNVTIDENEVINRINTAVTNEFNNLTVDECMGSARASNILEQSKAHASDGGVIDFVQKASAESISKCLIDRKIGNSAFSSIVNDASFKAMSETEQKAKTDAEADQDAEMTIEEEITSGIADMWKNLMKMIGPLIIIIPIIIGLVILGAIVFFVFGGKDIIMKLFSGDDMNNDFEQEGGAIAIHTVQRAIILVAIVGGIDYIAKQFNK
jgi:hypothetical protein